MRCSEKLRSENLRKNSSPNVVPQLPFAAQMTYAYSVSYEVLKLIAKKLKPYDDGARAKKTLIKAAKELAPKSAD